MHELSLAGGIVKLVEEAAARERFTRVSRLRLQAGALAGVDVRALRFALESIVGGTCLQDTDITIDQSAGSAWCLRCAVAVEIGSRLEPCPRCGGHQLQPTGGTELRVLDLVVHD